jgi:WD40 repeat protein
MSLNAADPLLSKRSIKSSENSLQNLSLPSMCDNSISPLCTFQPVEVNSISDVISQINNYITDKFSVLSNTVYTFTDIKLVSSQSLAFGVTNEGFCISWNLLENLYEEVSLCKNGLSGILIFNKENNALVKEKANGKIYVIELPDMTISRVIIVQGEGNNGIGRMCLSPDEQFLFARLWKGEIVRWSLKNFEQDLALSARQAICMNVSPDGVVVLGTIDKKIQVFSSDLEKIRERVFEFKIDAFISFSQNGQLIILALANEVKVLNMSNLNIFKVFQVGCQVYECVMTQNNSFIVAPLESGELAFIDMSTTGKVSKLQIHSGCIKSVFLIDGESQVMSFGDDFKVARTKFPESSIYKKIREVNPNQSPTRSQEFVRETISSQLSDPELKNFKVFCTSESYSGDIMILAGQSKNIIIFEIKNSIKLGSLSGHDDFVYSLESLTDEICVSGSADCSIKVWNFRTLSYLFTLLGHHDTVTCLSKIDYFRLCSGSKDKSIKIWLWEEKSIIFQVLSLPSGISSFLIPKPEILLVGMKELIQCWELKSYTLVFQKHSSAQSPNLKKLETMIGGCSRPYITLGNEDESCCFSDPFKSTEIKVIGEDEYSEYRFLSYLQTIVMYKVPQYDESNDKWMIFPFMVTTLHYYSFFDMPEFLYQAISKGAGLVPCSTGETPLSIALNKRHTECVKSIVQAAWDKKHENPSILASLTVESVILLCSLNVSHLCKIFDLLLVKYESTSKYCPESCKLPVIKTSVPSLVLTSTIFDLSKDGEKDIEIVFKRSLLPLPLETGSVKSIELLESLCSMEKIKIFNSELVKVLILFKWGRVKILLLAEFLIFSSFFVCVLILDKESYFSIMTALGISLLLTVENLVITFKSGKVDFWAVCDYLRCGLMGGYVLINFLGLQVDYVHVSLTIATSIQGLQYFKLFKRTRRLMMVLMKIGNDIISFVIILIYLLLCLGAILHIIAIREDLHSINQVSLITISEENASVFIENLFLVFMTFINPIIMLNILLALSAENYKKDGSKAKELKELSLSILRCEYLLLSKSCLPDLKYLQICASNKTKKSSKLKTLSKLIKILSTRQKSSQSDLLKRFSIFDSKLKTLHEKIESLSEIKHKSRRSPLKHNLF